MRNIYYLTKLVFNKSKKFLIFLNPDFFYLYLNFTHCYYNLGLMNFNDVIFILLYLIINLINRNLNRKNQNSLNPNIWTILPIYHNDQNIYQLFYHHSLSNFFFLTL